MATSEFTHEFFEEASTIWKANKIRYGQASYTYKKGVFQKDCGMPPPPKLSADARKQLKKELEMRQNLDEDAPPRVRKSPRLREKEIQSVYCSKD